jgi:4-amino-4-deoxy-L-arabinose transferase-like glycosyltransferase
MTGNHVSLAARCADLLALAAVLAGVFLLFHRLDWNGSTWDERVDFNISRHFVQQGSILIDKSDPSQARLPHIVGALSLAAFGESLWAFKFPFALAGLVAGALLFAFVAVRHGNTTALYCLAFLLTNPWWLGSSRTAATAGDVLVVVTTFAFLWGAIVVFRGSEDPRRRLAGTAGFGLLTGISIGAKLTSAVLLPAGFALVAVARRSLLHLVVFTLLALLATVALHPLLVTHTQSTLGATTQAFRGTAAVTEDAGDDTAPAPALAPAVDAGAAPVLLGPGWIEATPKVRYLSWLLVGKLTLPFLLVVAAGIVLGLYEAWRVRRLDPGFWGALAMVLVPCVVLIWKYKQNANYYLPLLLPAVTLAAIPLARGLRSPFAWRRVAVAFGWLAIVGWQLWIDTNLAPDYLQAGRRLGPEAQGQMSGPATNHCQGTPVMIETLNRLRQSGEPFEAVGVFETCLAVILHDAALGPVAPDGYRFVRLGQAARPSDAYIFVVHEVIAAHQYGLPAHATRLRWLEQAKLGCTWVNADAPDDRFRIYSCPERG